MEFLFEEFRPTFGCVARRLMYVQYTSPSRALPNEIHFMRYATKEPPNKKAPLLGNNQAGALFRRIPYSSVSLGPSPAGRSERGRDSPPPRMTVPVEATPLGSCATSHSLARMRRAISHILGIWPESTRLW